MYLDFSNINYIPNHNPYHIIARGSLKWKYSKSLYQNEQYSLFRRLGIIQE